AEPTADLEHTRAFRPGLVHHGVGERPRRGPDIGPVRHVVVGARRMRDAAIVEQAIGLARAREEEAALAEAEIVGHPGMRRLLGRRETPALDPVRAGSFFRFIALGLIVERHPRDRLLIEHSCSSPRTSSLASIASGPPTCTRSTRSTST